MLKCYLGRFSVRRRCVAPHYRLHWATKIRKIREINTFRHYFSPRGPKKCAAAKWAQGRNAATMRAGGRAADRTEGGGPDGGRRTGRRAATGGLRAGQDARAGGHTTEGGGPDGWVDGWAGSRFSSRFSSRLSAQHAARATRAGRRPANRPPRPGAPHPAAGCAGWSGCRTGGTESRSSHCPCAG